MTLYLVKSFCFDQDLSEDELAAREAEAGMQGRTHNLLNQSVAAGYRTNGASSRQGLSNSSPADGKDHEGGGSIRGEKKRSKRPRPGGPPPSPRAAPSGAAGGGGGGGGAAAAAGLVVERPSARYLCNTRPTFGSRNKTCPMHTTQLVPCIYVRRTKAWRMVQKLTHR